MKTHLSLLMYILFLILLTNCSGEKEKTVSEKIAIQQDSSISVREEEFIDDILVKSIQIGGENLEVKNKLQVFFPHTQYDFINKLEEEFAEDYREEFVKESQLINKESTSGITFLQHFEVLSNTDSLIVFLFEQNRSFGNNFSDEFYTRYYNIASERLVPIDEFFKSNEAFNTFAHRAKVNLQDTLKFRIFNNSEYNEEDKERLWEGMKDFINEGTLAKNKNYDAVLFRASEKYIEVRFDKYQVASGDFGAITIRIPKSDIRPLIKNEYLTLLGIDNSNLKDKKKVKQLGSNKAKRDTISENYKADLPMIALTFDDGPSIHTPRLLDILKAENVKVTFFILGKSAQVQKNTVKRASHEGHQIANHSWNHKNLVKVSEEELKHQIFATNNVIESLIDIQPNAFRPPYGSLNDMVKSTAKMPIILWNVDPMDWKDRDAEIVAKRIGEAQANSIILAHDIHKTTVNAIPIVIKHLKNKGYQFVTINEMFKDQDLQSGRTYSHKK